MMVSRLPAAVFTAVLSLMCHRLAHAQQDAALSAERRSAVFTEQVRAAYAYGLGLSGKGVTIAVLDTGIAADHPEFSGTGKIAAGYNAVAGHGDVADTVGHGTHVSGLLTAARDGAGMHGIAYGATLLPVKVFDGGGKGDSAALDRGLRQVIGKAAIANLSLSSASAPNPSALREALASGMLLVVAAGNSAGADPQWPARYAKEAWAGQRLIAVGAVDESNRLAAFSNRAGDAAPWFLVAPGVNLVSTVPGGYGAMSGTSMAAPIVSGAAALILQMWPYLRAEQVATILFITATDLGAPGIDPVYGRGLLNVEKALQPVGVVRTRNWAGSTIRILETRLAPSPATSRFWSLAAAGALDAVGTDDFHRAYALKMGASIARPPTMSLEQVFGDIAKRSEIIERVLDNGAQLRVQASPAEPGRAARALSGFAYAAPASQRVALAFGHGGMAGPAFGIAGMPMLQESGADRTLAHPYFSLLPGAAHLALGIRPTLRTAMKLGWLQAGTGPVVDERDPVSGLPRDQSMRVRAEMAMAELQYGDETRAVSLSLSRTLEHDAFLATQSQGAYGFGPSTTTIAAQLGAAWQLAPQLVLAGQAAWGVTPDSIDRLSLISAMSPLRTNAFSVALVAAGRFCPDDRLSLALSQPLRTYAGSITLDAVTAIDEDGREVRSLRTLGMVPTARETMLEFDYRRPLGQATQLGLVLSLRRHPNHLEEVAVEKLVAMRVTHRF